MTDTARTIKVAGEGWSVTHHGDFRVDEEGNLLIVDGGQMVAVYARGHWTAATTTTD